MFLKNLHPLDLALLVNEPETAPQSVKFPFVCDGGAGQISPGLLRFQEFCRHF